MEGLRSNFMAACAAHDPASGRTEAADQRLSLHDTASSGWPGGRDAALGTSLVCRNTTANCRQQGRKRKIWRSSHRWSARPRRSFGPQAEGARVCIYAHHFTNRKMADGSQFNPNSNAAASKTLPLGTVAKVTNQHNGRTAVIKVEDRGPLVPLGVLSTWRQRWLISST